MAARPDGRIADRFDAYPTTANIIALVDGSVAGTVRFMERSAAGVSTDEYFDFSGLVPAGARDGSGSMLVVGRDYRRVPRMIVAMLGMGYYWSVSRGLSHLLATMNPQRRAAMERSGWRAVSPQFHDEQHGVDVLPMLLDLDTISDMFLDFISRQGIRHWLQAFERQFHTNGETVIQKGDPGEAAYVIVDGQAAVIGGDGTTIDTLGPGDLFGELALLTRRPRSATVLAVGSLDLMVLERDAFRAQLRENPDTAERLLDLLARRMADLRAGPGDALRS